MVVTPEVHKEMDDEMSRTQLKPRRAVKATDRRAPASVSPKKKEAPQEPQNSPSTAK